MCSPWRPRCLRRVRRSGVARSTRTIRRYSAASSCACSAEKCFSESSSSSLADRTGTSISSESSSSSPMPPDWLTSLPPEDSSESSMSFSTSVSGSSSESFGGAGSSSRSGSNVLLPALPKTSRKTRSNVGTWMKPVTKIARVAQYRRRRDTGLVSASECAYCWVCDGVTGMPAACRRWLNAPTTAGRSSSRSSIPKAPSSCTAEWPFSVTYDSSSAISCSRPPARIIS